MIDQITKSNDSIVLLGKFLYNLILLIIFTLLISALITPKIFFTILKLVPDVTWPFSRVFDRVAMVVALLLIILFRNRFQLTTLLRDVSPYLKGHKFLTITKGLLLSFLVSLLMVILLVNFGTLNFSAITIGEFFVVLAKAIPAALIISIIEEVFFRFFLFYSLRRYLSFLSAAVFSSILYSILHFIQPVKTFQPDPNNLYFTGLDYLFALVERYTLPGILEAGFGLFLVGICLCLIVERTNSLLPAIGLHSGWVVAIKVIGKITEAPIGFEYPAGAGRRYFLLTEYLGWLGIIIVGVLAIFIFRKFNQEQKG